jgi:hypothetical protein
LGIREVNGRSLVTGSTSPLRLSESLFQFLGPFTISFVATAANATNITTTAAAAAAAATTAYISLIW